MALLHSVTQPASLRVALAAALLLSACSPFIEVHGFVPAEEQITRLKPGVHRQKDVADLLGSPSNVGTFREDAWYYVTRRTERVAFFESKTIDQRVVVVKFDKAGFLKGITHYALADGREIEPIDRVTRTRGQELGFFEQIIGNVGRFPGKDAANPDR